jgi:hypothetical protein
MKCRSGFAGCQIGSTTRPESKLARFELTAHTMLPPDAAILLTLHNGGPTIAIASNQDGSMKRASQIPGFS